MEEKKINHAGWGLKCGDEGETVRIKSPTKFHGLSQGLLFGLLGLMSLGNTECQSQTEPARNLKRRVQMSRITAPPIELPQGGKFDFAYVANMQMYHMLSKTDAFSTATIDPEQLYSVDGLNSSEAEVFRRCEEEEDTSSPRMDFKTFQKSSFSSQAACMMDLPHGVISGSVIDFTLVNATGVGLKLAQIPFLSGLNFEFKKFELSVGMRVMHPLIRGGLLPGDRKIIATTQKNAYQKEYNTSFRLNFAGFELGPSHYYRSPLRKVVDDAFTDALKDLADQWNKAEPWYAMVLRSCDKFIYINAGNKTDANLKVGDILRIHNVVYRWNGPACRSELLGQVDSVQGPVGYARVISVGDTLSAAEFLDKDPQYPFSRDQVIRPGARVYMEKMWTPPPAPSNPQQRRR